jgi:hypothetical protein
MGGMDSSDSGKGPVMGSFNNKMDFPNPYNWVNFRLIAHPFAFQRQYCPKYSVVNH